jgi:hypothetical protein
MLQDSGCGPNARLASCCSRRSGPGVRAAIQADVERRLCPHLTLGHILTWASPTNNHRNGRNWRISRPNNSKRRRLDPRTRQPPASSQLQHPRLNQTRIPRSPVAVGRDGAIGDGRLEPHPDGRARPSGNRQSRPSIRTMADPPYPAPAGPGSLATNPGSLRRYNFFANFGVKYRLTH